VKAKAANEQHSVSSRLNLYGPVLITYLVRVISDAVG